MLVVLSVTLMLLDLFVAIMKVTQITSIRRRPNFDEFPRHFRVISRCNFAGRKIHVISTYFLRCNFDGRKIHVVSTYFYWCNFTGQKIHVVSTYFFRCNFDGRKIYVVSTYFFSMYFVWSKYARCFYLLFST